MFWELYRQGRIGRATPPGGSATRTARETAGRLRELEMRVDQLTLINMALWSFLQEKHALTDEELAERVREIDLADGHLDGKIRATPVECASCGRTMSTRHARCLYCGIEAGENPLQGTL